MSDILQEAEALIEKRTASGYIHRDATLLLPRLVAEIKRLQAQGQAKDFGLSGLSNEVYRLREQLAAWQKIAIDQRVAWSEEGGWPRTRDEAAKELGLQGYKTNGPIEINGEKYVKESEQKAYTEQLEKDFIFYARSYEYLRDPDKWRPHQERYAKAEQKAQAVLEEIRGG